MLSIRQVPLLNNAVSWLISGVNPLPTSPFGFPGNGVFFLLSVKSDVHQQVTPVACLSWLMSLQPFLLLSPLAVLAQFPQSKNTSQNRRLLPPLSKFCVAQQVESSCLCAIVTRENLPSVSSPPTRGSSPPSVQRGSYPTGRTWPPTSSASD